MSRVDTRVFLARSRFIADIAGAAFGMSRASCCAALRRQLTLYGVQAMDSSAHEHHLAYSDLFRWSARSGGAILFAGWLGLVVAELVRLRLATLSTNSCYRAVALAVVFIGYAVGGRGEVLGGLLAFLGVAIYYLVVVLTAGIPPGMEATLFAAPGVIFLLAWCCDHRNVRASSKVVLKVAKELDLSK
jgi:hypothetical protein